MNFLKILLHLTTSMVIKPCSHTFMQAFTIFEEPKKHA